MLDSIRFGSALSSQFFSLLLFLLLTYFLAFCRTRFLLIFLFSLFCLVLLDFARFCCVLLCLALALASARLLSLVYARLCVWLVYVVRVSVLRVCAHACMRMYSFVLAGAFVCVSLCCKHSHKRKHIPSV